MSSRSHLKKSRLHAEPADIEGIFAWHQIGGAPCRPHRNLQTVAEFGERPLGLGQADAVSRQDQWPLRAVKRPDDCADLLR